MSLDQRRLWRNLGWLGALNGLLAVLSIFGLLALGIGTNYFDRAFFAEAQPVFGRENPRDYILTLLAAILLWMLPLLSGALALAGLRAALFPPDAPLMNQIAGVFNAIPVICSALVGIFFIWGEQYTHTPQEHTQIIAGLYLSVFLYNLSFQASLLLLMWGASTSGHLSRRVCVFVSLLTVALMLLEIAFTYPETPFNTSPLSIFGQTGIVVSLCASLWAQAARTTPFDTTVS